MNIQRTVFRGLSLSFTLWAVAAMPHAQTSGALRELFSHSDGILFSLNFDLPDSEVTSEQAKVYCLEKLAALGVPVANLSGEKMRGVRMPRLAISISGKTVPVSSQAAQLKPAEPHWYEVRYAVEFWDEVVYKRDPNVERYMPILFSVMTGTFFTREDYLTTAASRRGVLGGLDQRFELFERACRGDWSFDPLIQMGGRERP